MVEVVVSLFLSFACILGRKRVFFYKFPPQQRKETLSFARYVMCTVDVQINRQMEEWINEQMVILIQIERQIDRLTFPQKEIVRIVSIYHSVKVVIWKSRTSAQVHNNALKVISVIYLFTFQVQVVNEQVTISTLIAQSLKSI